VLVPTTTFTATAEVVRYFDAKPVLVDVEADSLCMDAEAARALPIIRGMAEDSIRMMGSSCKPYLDEQRAKANAELREAIDRAGWMHTGDLATIDAEGYCAIVGRIKDMVIRGGENIYPREVEEFLYRHPKVQAAQVVGVPDAKYGEELCAWISLTEGASVTEEEIRAFCRDRIAHQKIPRYIRFVDEFPMTVTGKVQKFIMRERMIAELGLGAGDAGAQPAALAGT